MIDNVPRGTRFLGMRFNEPMHQALELGLKSQTRRIITAGNSQLARGADFERLDLSTGRPTGSSPVSCLQARMMMSGGERRTVRVSPRLMANAVVWGRRGQSGAAAKRENAKVFLRVMTVAPCRLNDISDPDALAEGILIFSPPEDRQTAERLPAVYDFLLGAVGKTRARAWRAGPVHAEVSTWGYPRPRDCFALMWEWLSGPGSWEKNPWVWRYTFQKLPVENLGAK